jgi:hypothetical protein
MTTKTTDYQKKEVRHKSTPYTTTAIEYNEQQDEKDGIILSREEAEERRREAEEETLFYDETPSSYLWATDALIHGNSDSKELHYQDGGFGCSPILRRRYIKESRQFFKNTEEEVLNDFLIKEYLAKEKKLKPFKIIKRRRAGISLKKFIYYRRHINGKNGTMD